MPSLQSPQAARIPNNDIELKVRADKQPESVQAMTRNPSDIDATRLRGGGCCVRLTFISSNFNYLWVLVGIFVRNVRLLRSITLPPVLLKEEER